MYITLKKFEFRFHHLTAIFNVGAALAIAATPNVGTIGLLSIDSGFAIACFLIAAVFSIRNKKGSILYNFLSTLPVALYTLGVTYVAIAKLASPPAFTAWLYACFAATLFFVTSEMKHKDD